MKMIVINHRPVQMKLVMLRMPVVQRSRSSNDDRMKPCDHGGSWNY